MGYLLESTDATTDTRYLTEVGTKVAGEANRGRRQEVWYKLALSGHLTPWPKIARCKDIERDEGVGERLSKWTGYKLL